LQIVASVATRRIRLRDHMLSPLPIASSGGMTGTAVRDQYDARQVLVAAYFALIENQAEGALSQGEFAALIHCFPSTFSDWRHEYRYESGAAHFWGEIAPNTARFAPQITAHLRAHHPAVAASIDDLAASPMRGRLLQETRGGRGR
jgi:hypothetical protein